MEYESDSSSASFQNGIGSNSTPSYAQAVSNCWNTPSSTNPGETSSSCLLCFENEMSRAEQPSSSGRSKLVKNFCEQLQLNSAEIPEECNKIMFPFCEICENELDLMFEHTQIILKSQSIISMMARKLEKKVIQEVGNWTDNPVHRDKFTKLWDMIIEGYGQRQSENGTRRSDSQSGHSDAEHEPDQMETNNPVGETVTVNVNPEACSISVAVKREHAMNDEEDLESDDEVQQVSMLQKRRTLCEGVEYWERIRRPGNERYLQCSLCSHTVPIYEKCKRGELTPYKTLAVHMRAEHKAECKKKGNNKRPGTSSKRARTKGDARADSESDPQPSTSRNQLKRNGVEVENGNADGDAPEHYVLKARKRKYTFMSVEILKYIGTRNPDKKYLECKRCHHIVPVNPRNKKGEKKAYKKIKKHIVEKNHRDKRKKKKSAAQKTLAGRAFQSERARVKVENPPNSGASEGDDEGETVGMPPIPVHPYTQPSAADGDEMPGVGDILPPDDAINMSMIMQTPSPAPHSPFYNYVYRSVQ